jgi:undecaprenyl diphosphate synthase
MSYKNQIQQDRIPRHVAIIMDGNGRWAKRQGLARMFGHRQGVETVHTITEAAAELGIEYLTLYAFSTENWNRPKEEVDALMSLLVDTIAKETPTLMKNNIRLSTIGDLSRLPNNAQQKFRACMQETSANTGLNLVLALSYSARWEIIRAAQEIASAIQKGDLLVDGFMVVKEQRVDINVIASVTIECQEIVEYFSYKDDEAEWAIIFAEQQFDNNLIQKSQVTKSKDGDVYKYTVSVTYLTVLVTG